MSLSNLDPAVQDFFDNPARGHPPAMDRQQRIAPEFLAGRDATQMAARVRSGSELDLYLLRQLPVGDTNRRQ